MHRGFIASQLSAVLWQKYLIAMNDYYKHPIACIARVSSLGYNNSPFHKAVYFKYVSAWIAKSYKNKVLRSFLAFYYSNSRKYRIAYN